jgi:rhodanese-related sulfurtransferase
MTAHTRIHPADLLADKNTVDLCIVDVRTPAEVSAESLKNCIHIPLHELTPERLQNELLQRNQQANTVYLLCQSGKRAEAAANQLQGKIAQDVCILEGGINAVKQANIPLQTAANPVMSLERQVRIAAGVLVMIGVGLGYFIHPGFYGLAGFVGAGLTFAGITDTCAMGMLIARTPWNR